MEDTLLDHEGEPQSAKYNPWRKPALAMEGLPLAVALIGALVGPDLLTIGCCTLAMVYLVGSWYLFKADKFRALDIIIAQFFGIGFSVFVFGILFRVQNWEGHKFMMSSANSTVMFLTPVILLIYFFRRGKKHEFTFSKKLALRVIIVAALGSMLR